MGRDTRRTRLLLAILVAATFTLVTIDYRTGRVGSGARSAAQSVFGPIETAGSAVVRPIGRTASSITHPNRYHDRADRLAQQNAQLLRQTASDAAVQREASQLAALRLIADRGQYTITPARVTSVGDVTGTDWTVTVNAGRQDGIKADELVLNDAGLVGTVVTVSATSSTVRLVCDPGSHIGARLEKTRLLGAIAGGNGPNSLSFTLYDASFQMRKGDRLVTFGSLDYAAGVPIGVVTKVLDSGQGLSRTAEVTPYVNIGTLDTVGIIVGKPARDPGDRVLPPLPVPAPKKPATKAPAAAGAAATSGTAAATSGTTAGTAGVTGTAGTTTGGAPTAATTPAPGGAR
ncbi:MAG: rod shape-determining protein MreC [Frankia sp.]